MTCRAHHSLPGLLATVSRNRIASFPLLREPTNERTPAQANCAQVSTRRGIVSSLGQSVISLNVTMAVLVSPHCVCAHLFPRRVIGNYHLLRVYGRLGVHSGNHHLQKYSIFHCFPLLWIGEKSKNHTVEDKDRQAVRPINVSECYRRKGLQSIGEKACSEARRRQLGAQWAASSPPPQVWMAPFSDSCHWTQSFIIDWQSYCSHDCPHLLSLAGHTLAGRSNKNKSRKKKQSI